MTKNRTVNAHKKDLQKPDASLTKAVKAEKKMKREQGALKRFFISIPVLDKWRPTGQAGVWDSEIRVVEAASFAAASQLAEELDARELDRKSVV